MKDILSNLRKHHLPYVECLESRDTGAIRLVVMHCTELPDLPTAREWGEQVVYAGTSTGNSGHFYIDRDGCIEEWVPVERVAHHVRGLNTPSIGIELVNRGRYPDWFNSNHQQMTEPYPKHQIDALLVLLKYLKEQYPTLTLIAAHADLDTVRQPAEDDPAVEIFRKRDPGPLFPWPHVLSDTGLVRIINYDNSGIME